MAEAVSEVFNPITETIGGIIDASLGYSGNGIDHERYQISRNAPGSTEFDSLPQHSALSTIKFGAATCALINRHK